MCPSNGHPKAVDSEAIDSDDAHALARTISSNWGQRLFAVHSQICEVVALARGHDQIDFVDLARQRPFTTA